MWRCPSLDIQLLGPETQDMTQTPDQFQLLFSRSSLGSGSPAYLSRSQTPDQFQILARLRKPYLRCSDSCHGNRGRRYLGVDNRSFSVRLRVSVLPFTQGTRCVSRTEETGNQQQAPQIRGIEPEENHQPLGHMSASGPGTGRSSAPGSRPGVPGEREPSVRFKSPSLTPERVALARVNTSPRGRAIASRPWSPSHGDTTQMSSLTRFVGISPPRFESRSATQQR
ncbi:unnamed protein product [Pleuronectes platessa]|uniref:Uncharacterized protein n=1 Tax=Pleuronectes platessa TaxID=8262 RepID=A0A9N7TV33_PLEPL|nr:unnamed protein product [Pleuronectes platessa]